MEYTDSQKLNDSLIDFKVTMKFFEKNITDMAVTVSSLKFQVDKIEKINEKQSALISASVKVGYISVIVFGILAAFVYGDLYEYIPEPKKLVTYWSSKESNKNTHN
jgi:hypothetical protein